MVFKPWPRMIAAILGGAAAVVGVPETVCGQSQVSSSAVVGTGWPTAGGSPEHVVARDEGPLSLQAAIAEALQQNPDLTAQRAAIDVARHRPARERALDPPMLGAQVWQWPISSLNPRNTGGYMLMAEQMFPGRGKRALRARAATAEIAVLEHDVVTDSRMVVEAVTMAYTELALARASADVYRANLRLLNHLADSAQVRYSVGHVAQADVLQPVVEISRMYDRLIEEDARAALAEARLNRWLGRPVYRPVGPLDALENWHLAAPIEQLQRVALEQQPALRAAAAEIDAADARLAVSRADYRPDLSLQAGYMVMPREGDTWTAQVAMTWPRAPWARRGLDARVAEAEQAVAAARARSAAVENEIRLAVQEAYVRVKTAERRAALLRTSIVPQIEQTFAVVRAAYQADRAELLSVIDVQRMLLETRLESLEAAAAFASAVAELARAVGKDLTDYIVPAHRRLPARDEGREP